MFVAVVCRNSTRRWFLRRTRDKAVSLWESGDELFEYTPRRHGRKRKGLVLWNKVRCSIEVGRSLAGHRTIDP
jgi:hypothetical protein